MIDQISADAMEPLGQDVQHEAPDELGRCQRHGFVAVRPLDPAGNCCLEKSRQIAESSTEPVSVTKAAYINRMKFNYLRRRLKDMSCRGVSWTRNPSPAPRGEGANSIRAADRSGKGAIIASTQTPPSAGEMQWTSA